MSIIFEEKENSIEEVKVESEEKVEEVEDNISFLEKILIFLTKYLGCSNKRADVIISANKPLEIETNDKKNLM